MYVIGGDIGGTKTILRLSQKNLFKPGENSDKSINNLAFFDTNAADETLLEHRYNSREYQKFDDLIGDFMVKANNVLKAMPGYDPEIHRVNNMVLGVAGSVTDNSCTTTNLPWTIIGEQLTRFTHIKNIKLINDFSSVCLGVNYLTSQDLHTIQPGEVDIKKPWLVVGAGTGLGCGFVVKFPELSTPHTNDPKDKPTTIYKRTIVASEAGHINFAPTNKQEERLLCWLETTIPLVSYEHLLSGRGICNIFDFLVQSEKQHVSSILLSELEGLKGDQKAPIISRYALENLDYTASRSLDLFASIYASWIGNMSLVAIPSRVYIAGGIAPKLLQKIDSDIFRHSYKNKAKHMQELLGATRIDVVLNQNVGLIGSVNHAFEI